MPGHSNQIPLTQDTDTWIEGESIRAFMQPQQQTQVISLCIAPIVFIVLYDYAYMPGLILWLVLSMLVAIHRWRVTLYHTNHLSDSDISAQIRFKAKNAWTWPASSALWGALVFLFFGHAPVFNQFVCFVVLASVGVFSATSYAAHAKTLKLFINTLMIVILCGMVWAYFTNTVAAEASLFYGIFPLQIVFWRALIRIGMRLNISHLQGLKLRKGNQDLIISLQDQTARANKAIETKNRFLASAAHDIRQPVLALDVYASMLRTSPDMVQVLTEKIELATNSVIEMFDSLFDLSRLDSGQLKITNSEVDIAKLMEELELQYKPAAHRKQLELRIRKGNFKIHTDPQLLKRILGNLLMNAIKFTNKGGILLACRRSHDEQHSFRFEVWDTGQGISADEQTAIFGEFYKSPTHLGTSEGFGLGLSIVSRLCDALGFRFSMQSRLQRGSVFIVEIPIDSIST